MQGNKCEHYKIEGSESDFKNSDTSCMCEKIKSIVADKLHKVAKVVGEKAADQNTQSPMAQYGKQASELLDKSAEYVREFDYDQADATIQEYVKRNPGQSLLIAGAVGLIIGAIFRRR